MRRSLSLAAVLALSSALALGGVAFAKSPSVRQDHPASHTLSTLGVAGHVSSAPQGGTLKVSAVLKYRGQKPAAVVTAVVHFASGDLTVVLVRDGRNSASYHGRAVVAAGAAIGPVSVTLTAVSGTHKATATAAGRIVPGVQASPAASPKA